MPTLLALDQSTTCTGYAVFVDEELKDCGCIVPSKKDNAETRIMCMGWVVKQLVNKFSPDLIALEDVHCVNANTYKKLAWIQWDIMSTAMNEGVEYTVLAPSTWRSILKIKSKKQNAIDYIKQELDISVVVDDISDAICIGLAVIKRSKK